MVVKRRIQELILEIRVFIPPSPLPLLVHASIINRTAIPKEYNSLILKHPQVGFDFLFIITHHPLLDRKKEKKGASSKVYQDYLFITTPEFRVSILEK